MSPRVLLVDDNQNFLSAAKRLLDAEGLAVVGTATNATEAIALTRSLRPEVALVDIKLGTESGIELSRRLVEESADWGLRVLLISTHAEEDFRDLIDASAAVGFVAKSALSAPAVLDALGEPTS
jgi:DNA-binding NarL/FixJ family response regulator